MSNETSSNNVQVATLKAQVFALVKACPTGRVTTYGWIGKALGYPRGARMIGWIMNESPQGVPAQRVINSKGELSGSWAFGQSGTMRQLLEAEGIVFSADERVDMKRYSWDPSRDLSEEELKHLLDAAAHTPVNASERLLYLMRNDPASPLRATEDSNRVLSRRSEENSWQKATSCHDCIPFFALSGAHSSKSCPWPS